MEQFSLYGAIFVMLLLIPNMVFAATHKDGFENLYKNRIVEALEQLGRFGCFAFMIYRPAFACGGWLFDGACAAYQISGALLTAMYIAGWVILWREDSVRKSLALSILPSLLFLESGVLTLNYPLIFLSVIFAPCHIVLSYQNAKLKALEDKT